MIVYLDSSAVIKLYVTEEHGDYVENVVRRVGWANVGIVAVSAVAYAEVSAAMAAMARSGRITPLHYERAMDKLLADLSDLYLVRHVTGAVLELAAVLPAPVLGTRGRYPLKGYDAMQLATALD
nr:type II toxin-antitoxin system VapC family toxin [Actinomycetota bacterium]